RAGRARSRSPGTGSGQRGRPALRCHPSSRRRCGSRGCPPREETLPVTFRRVATEAALRITRGGASPDGDGWFVLNARDSRWRDDGAVGRYCTFEGKRRFPQLGININVLEPGQPLGFYHRENAQEDFLVVEGQCTLIVEGEQRLLRTWDFFHCPPGTEHVLVG